MKIIMEFNLPDDDYEYKMTINGRKYYAALGEIMEYMRSQIKYNSENMSVEKFTAYEELYDKFYQILNEGNVRIDEV